MKLLIFLAILCFFVWATISIIIWTIKNGISPMPTSPAAKKCLLEALPKDISGTIVDLGSGWGTLVFPLARQFPHCQVIGYENSPFPYWFSNWRHFFFRLPNLTLIRQDFFQVPLNDVSLVICYLYPGAMRRLKGKLEKELPTETWVISNTFAIPGWEEIQVFTANDLYQTKIYLYRTSAPVSEFPTCEKKL